MGMYDYLTEGTQSKPDVSAGSGRYDYLLQDSHNEEPGLISKALHGVGSLLDPLGPAEDWISRKVARAQGLPVSDEATTPQMLRSFVGLNQGDEGYAGHLGGKALEFGAEMARNPLTWTGLGLEGTAGKTAAGLLAAQGGIGAYQEGKHAYNTLQREGFTPQAAEELLGAGLSAGMAGLAGTHAFRKGAPPSDIEAFIRQRQQYQPPPSDQFRGHPDQVFEMPPATETPQGPELPPDRPFAPPPIKTESAPDKAEAEVLAKLLPTIKDDQWNADFEKRMAYYESHGMTASAELAQAENARRTALPAEPIPLESLPTETPSNAPPETPIQPAPPQAPEGAPVPTPEPVAALPPFNAEPVPEQVAGAPVVPVQEPAPIISNEQAPILNSAPPNETLPLQPSPNETLPLPSPNETLPLQASPNETIPAAPSDVRTQADSLAALGWKPNQIAALNPDLISGIIERGEAPKYADTPEPGRAMATNLGGRADENLPSSTMAERQAALAQKQADLVKAAGEENNPLFGGKPKYAVDKRTGLEDPTLSDAEAGRIRGIINSHNTITAKLRDSLSNATLEQLYKKLEHQKRFGWSDEDTALAIYKEIKTRTSAENASMADLLNVIAQRKKVEQSFLKTATPEELQERADFYRRSGKTESLSAIMDELASRNDRKLSAGAPEPNAHPLTPERVQAAFPGLDFKPQEDGSHVSTLKDGSTLRVSPVGDIEVTNDKALAESAKAGGVEGDVFAAGSYQRVGRDGVVQIAKQAPAGTEHHEAFHFFFDKALSPKEKAAVLAKYGDEESAAYAYQEWTPKTVNSWFSKILQYAQRVYRSFKPTYDSVFGEVRSGRASERIAGEPSGNTGELAPKYAVRGQAPETQPTPLPGVDGPPKPSWSDKLREAWKAGLLSGPSTQIVKGTGDLLRQGMALAETAFTSHVTEPLLAKAQGREVERFKGEAAGSWAAARAEAPKAFSQWASDVGKALTLKPEETRTDSAGLELQPGAIGGKLGTAVRTPFRIFEATTDMAKSIASEQELYKQAIRRFKGNADQAHAFVETFKGLSDEQKASQYPDVTSAMDRAQKELTYQGPYDESKAIEGLAQFVSKAATKYPALDLIFPFRKVPAKIATATLERSPYGFKYAYDAYKQYKAGKISAGEVSDALTKPVLGTAAMLTFGAAAKAGMMTGGGPVDVKKKLLLEQTGWRPYSFVIPGPNGPQYLAYNRFEPASSLLGMAADAVESGNEKNAGDVMDKIGGTILDNMVNKSFLTGLENASLILSDPKRYGSQVVKSTVGSVVPNIVAKAAQAIDPTVRDTSGGPGLEGFGESLGKTIMSRIPFATQELAPKRAGTGEEVTRPGSAIERFASPFTRSEAVPGTEVDKFLVDEDAVPGAPSKNFTVPGTHGKQVQLSDTELSVLQDANQKATDYVKKNFMNNPRFTRLDPDEQKRMIESAYSKARTEARDKLMRNSAFRNRAKQEIATQG